MPSIPSLMDNTLKKSDDQIGGLYTANRDKNNPAIPKSQVGAYQGGLQTSFTGSAGGTDYHGYANDYGAKQNDADVTALQRLVNDDYSGTHGNNGVDFSANAALENMYRGRIGTKNSLAENIQGNASNEKKQEDLLTGAAGQALGQGLKNTRQNYNNRGLLYSGLRQGGEQEVKQGVASSLDQSISGARRDSANSLSGAQNAYAAVDLANSQESLNLAHQAFDTASANNIARLQAMQQLGSGVGAVAGYMYGSSGGGGTQSTGPSGPSNYNTAVTGNYYDSAPNGLIGRTA